MVEKLDGTTSSKWSDDRAGGAAGGPHAFGEFLKTQPNVSWGRFATQRGVIFTAPWLPDRTKYTASQVRRSNSICLTAIVDDSKYLENGTSVEDCYEAIETWSRFSIHDTSRSHDGHLALLAKMPFSLSPLPTSRQPNPLASE